MKQCAQKRDELLCGGIRNECNFYFPGSCRWVKPSAGLHQTRIIRSGQLWIWHESLSVARMGPSTSLIYITQADRPPSACIRLQAKARIQTDLHDGNKVNIQKQNQRYIHTIHYYERARCVHG